MGSSDQFNNLYKNQTEHKNCPELPVAMPVCVSVSGPVWGWRAPIIHRNRKEGYVLFNDALNTF